ncbi:MAG: ABC transporter permease [Christensenellales bacterium]|jgi:peptide/nickel transport system permease protein
MINKRKTYSSIGKYLNINLIIGIGILFPLIILTIFAPQLSPYSPTEVFTGEYNHPPDGLHLMGTDSMGMDVFTRLLYAPRIDLFIGILATALGVVIGIPLGLYIGYYESGKGINSYISLLIIRILDVIQAFPVFILGLAVVAITGKNVNNVIYVLGFIWVPVFARLVRTEVLRIRDSLFVLQERVIGQRNSAILFKHIMPNAISPAITQISTCIASSILLAAGLSFVGAGVSMPQPELGLMISIGARGMIIGKWWPVVFPGMMLGLLVFGLSMLGEGIAQSIDPRNWR